MCNRLRIVNVSRCDITDFGIENTSLQSLIFINISNCKIYMVKTLKWLPCGGAIDKTSNDSNFFPWTAWKTTFRSVDGSFSSSPVCKRSSDEFWWYSTRGCCPLLFFFFSCSLTCFIKPPVWFWNFTSAALFFIDPLPFSPSLFFSIF